MAHFFGDSSVLVKRHVREVGTSWLQALTDPSSGNIIIIAALHAVPAQHHMKMG
jgi:hypothetical protein